MSEKLLLDMIARDENPQILTDDIPADERDTDGDGLTDIEENNIYENA